MNIQRKRMLRKIPAILVVIITILLNSFPIRGSSLPVGKPIDEPRIKVTVDMAVVEREQQSVDEGHSPWKLDPLYVAQVFVNLKISPGGIIGDYPVKYEEFKILQLTERDAVVGVDESKSPVARVYLKRLVRQNNSGIWTVIGYDPASGK